MRLREEERLRSAAFTSDTSAALLARATERIFASRSMNRRCESSCKRALQAVRQFVAQLEVWSRKKHLGSSFVA